jgi:hypothetical protein
MILFKNCSEVNLNLYCGNKVGNICDACSCGGCIKYVTHTAGTRGYRAIHWGQNRGGILRKGRIILFRSAPRPHLHPFWESEEQINKVTVPDTTAHQPGTGFRDRKSLLKVWGGERSLAQTGFHIHRNSLKGSILLTRTVRPVVCYESTESSRETLQYGGSAILSSNKQRMPGFDGVPRSRVHAGVPSTPVGHGKVEQSGVRATRYIAVVPVTSLVFSSW